MVVNRKPLKPWFAKTTLYNSNNMCCDNVCPLLHPSITIEPTSGSSGFKTNKITGPDSEHNRNALRQILCPQNP